MGHEVSSPTEQNLHIIYVNCPSMFAYSDALTIIEAKGSIRQMPLSPEMFALQLASRKFTSRGDKITVVKLYTETSLRMLRGLTKMDLDGIKMEPGGAEQLAASVQFCQSLEELHLRGMDMGDAGAAALAALCSILCKSCEVDRHSSLKRRVLCSSLLLQLCDV